MPTDIDARWLLADSVTDLSPTASNRVVASGSHAGVFSAQFAAYIGVGGIVFNDAGVGRDAAGIAGLEVLDGLRIPAGAVDHSQARIGIAVDTAAARLSHVNSVAEALGCHPGDRVLKALAIMQTSPAQRITRMPQPSERRTLVGVHRIRVCVVDSASLVPDDEEAIVVTGSHGGLPGDDPARALKQRVRAAVFNDAGGGLADAGFGRLAVLGEVGVPAATVASTSARIGDGFSTYHDGVVSRVNGPAQRIGIEAGMKTVELIETMERLIL